MLDLLIASGSDVEASWGLALAPLWLIASYLLIMWESRRDAGVTRDDGQVGLKLVACFLFLVGLTIATGGAVALLHYLLSGARAGKEVLKLGIASLIAGAAPVFAIVALVLPRTNAAQHPRASRLLAGFVAAGAGFATLTAFNTLLQHLIQGSAWLLSSRAMAALLVFGGVALFAVARLGALSGWSGPTRAAPPAGAGGYPSPSSYPGATSSYPGPAPGAGYPPQGGGYPQR